MDSYRHQSADLYRRSNDWFLHKMGHLTGNKSRWLRYFVEQLLRKKLIKNPWWSLFLDMLQTYNFIENNSAKGAFEETFRIFRIRTLRTLVNLTLWLRFYWICEPPQNEWKEEDLSAIFVKNFIQKKTKKNKKVRTTFTFRLFSLRMICHLGKKKKIIEIGIFLGKRQLFCWNHILCNSGKQFRFYY